MVQTTYENFRYHYEGKLNPYNRGCTRNVMEIFFTRIPKSKNNFRARVTEDSSTFNPSASVTKTSFDIEMGRKRQAVSAEEFEDIQNQFGLERCRPQPEHSLWGEKGNWEFTPDILALAAEYEMELGFKDRDKTHGSHLNGPWLRYLVHQESRWSLIWLTGNRGRSKFVGSWKVKMPGNWHKQRVSDTKMDVIWLFRLCSIWQLERLIGWR